MGRRRLLVVVVGAAAAGIAAAAYLGTRSGSAAHRRSPPPVKAILVRHSGSCGRALGGDAPTWLADGRLAYVGPGPRQVIRDGVLTGARDLYRIQVAGLREGSRCAVPGESSQNWSLVAVREAARGRLVYADDNFGLFSLDRRTHRAVRIGDVDAADNSRLFAVSSSGREVVFTGYTPCPLPTQAPCTRVGVVPAAGGRVRWISGKSDRGDDNPSLSPDGRRVVFQRGLELVVEPVRRRRPVVLAAHGERPAWSPDGRWIAYADFLGNSRWRLEVVDVRTGKTRALTKAASLVGFSWSPDSRRLAFVTGGRIGTVGLTGTTTSFALPHGLLPTWQTIVNGPAWSPNGRRIAFALRVPKPRIGEVASRVYVIDGDGERLRRLA